MDAETKQLVNGLLSVAAAGWIVYTMFAKSGTSESQQSDGDPHEESAASDEAGPKREPMFAPAGTSGSQQPEDDPQQPEDDPQQPGDNPQQHGDEPQQASAATEETGPDRESIRQRTRRNKLLFTRRSLLSRQYQLSLTCSCDKCLPSMYFKWLRSCEVKHTVSDLEILPWLRPDLKSEYDKGTYEALRLARSTIEYFSHPLADMDTKQRAAVDGFRNWEHREDFINALNQYDTRTHFKDDWLSEAVVFYFDEIFFFGHLDALQIDWVAENLDEHGRKVKAKNLGLTRRENALWQDGTEIAMIQLHPTRTSYRKEDYAAWGQTVAEERVGTILHELLHAFLLRHTCRRCPLVENFGWNGHGRAWQLLAKAIEEQSMRLIGMNVDLGRLTSWDRAQWKGQFFCA
jgi:hypothetical protein